MCREVARSQLASFPRRREPSAPRNKGYAINSKRCPFRESLLGIQVGDLLLPQFSTGVGRRHQPDSWAHDLAFLQSDKDMKAQVQLFQDYQTNIDAYPARQALLRERQYPTLIARGQAGCRFARSLGRAQVNGAAISS